MKLLFVHQNFPGQYKHLMPYCAANGHQVLGMGSRSAQQIPASIPYWHYPNQRGNLPATDPLTLDFDSKMIRAASCADAAIRLRDQQDFHPDVICAHTGWGEELFLKDVWPEAKVIGYCEYYYNAIGFDANFDTEFPSEPVLGTRKLLAKNASILLSLQGLDGGVSPTEFQRSTYPSPFRERIRVIHDGVDTASIVPNETVFAEVRGQRLTRADEVITFVSRSLEPVRGFHIFMRALPRLLQQRPRARVLIVGAPDGGYGAHPEVPFKQQLLQELSGQLDLDRIHFLGRVPYADFLRLLMLSRCHVYLTIPFVLSWSLMESMAAGCVVVGSDTAPLREVIRHGENGLLVNFFDSVALADQIAAVLADPAAHEPLRAAARQTIVSGYERTACLQQHLALIEAALRDEAWA
jgi:glycosyltransferase involved in cell wall biosynthesis